MVTAEDKHMLSINNNDYDYIGREEQVIELYNQGKSTRDIVKESGCPSRDLLHFKKESCKPWNYNNKR